MTLSITVTFWCTRKSQALLILIVLCIGIFSSGCESPESKPPEGRGDWTKLSSAPCSSVNYVSDSEIVVGYDNGELKVYDLNVGKFTDNGHSQQKNIYELGSWGNKTVAVCGGSAEKKLTVWDRATKQVRHLALDETMMVHEVAWSPDGKYLAAVQSGVGLFVWDTVGWKIVYSYACSPRSVAWSETGKFIFTCDNISSDDLDGINQSHLIAVDFAGRGGELFRIPVPGRLESIQCDRNRIICGLGDRIAIYENSLESPKLIKEMLFSEMYGLPESLTQIDMVYSRQSNLIACSFVATRGAEKPLILVISLEDGTAVAKWIRGDCDDIGSWSCISFSPDGSKLAFSSNWGLFLMPMDKIGRVVWLRNELGRRVALIDRAGVARLACKPWSE
jgi:WD40 repeat protein